MQNNYYESASSGESKEFNDCNEVFETTTIYREEAMDENPTNNTENGFGTSSNNQFSYKTPRYIYEHFKNNRQEYGVEDKMYDKITRNMSNTLEVNKNAKLIPNGVYENAVFDENCIEPNGCKYIREKSNSLISGRWVPKNPKVFVRRIDGSKNPPKETAYRVVNGNYNMDEKPMPYDSKSRDSFVKQKLEEFENMPCEYIGASTKRIISPEEGQAILRTSNNSKDALKNFCVVDNYPGFTNVPLCVQETIQTNEQHIPSEFPRPLIQDEYYFRYVMSQANPQKCAISGDSAIRVMKVFVNCLYKTMKLAIQKVRAELDTSATPIVFQRNPLPNMDVACNVCEQTEEQRMNQPRATKDFISHFEGRDQPFGFLKRIMNIFDAFDTPEYTAPPLKIREPVEPHAYYQAEVFPKDTDGKVILPKFEDSEK